MHEESVRIPMFFYWNKFKINQTITEALVCSTSVFAMILDLAGLPIPDHLNGKSLSPILSDPSTQIHAYVASESVGVGGKIGTGHRMIRSKPKVMIPSEVLLSPEGASTFWKDRGDKTLLFTCRK
ncbi:sulfatase/phosphatase domain-containing protein [Cyclobacterium jeungdonense]|uniref:N-sulphoglucosamine sulphohydrolase C-terminal domain-containing protein n=1 Tax=Cyclobacterium jeungdonense TaxID=708087 RepID=A0ABT8CFM2_9BACT|nr:sulfatase/phosphatase domain-containing protein [Cyclobacterium jeungdonense]MDN3690510.1 hypothetical protein [Cyclobacterium jeungdonense]